MKIVELKNWLNQLPAELDEFTIVNAELGGTDEDNGTFTYRLDKPVVTVVINEDSKELLILNVETPQFDEVPSDEE
jgi:hypothetical protein